MENVVNKEYCREHGRVIDERFARDQADIKAHNEAIANITKLSTEIGTLIKQHDDTIKSHESRIDTLERKPSVWLDRIVAWVVGAVIAAIVAAMLSGNIKF